MLSSISNTLSYKLWNPSYYNTISSLQSQIRLLTEARDRMLPKLMSGEIAVEGGRPERPLSCQPNGNALGINE